MSNTQNKGGRPKNPTTVKLERKIKKLEEEIDALLNAETNVTEMAKENLKCKAFGVIVRDKKFNLVEINFDPNTKQAMVVDETHIADSSYRATFHLNKMIAYNEFLNKEEIK